MGLLRDVRDLLYLLVLFQRAQRAQDIGTFGPDVDALLANVRTRLGDN